MTGYLQNQMEQRMVMKDSYKSMV
ncbi:MAG: hypothetical protein ACLUVC_07855 [Longibaculum sp.]